MANRSYLYSSNLIPGPDLKKEDRKLVGISEQSYAIPIVYKLLLSGNPRVCSSSIWVPAQDIALVGDYQPGVDRLKEFLQRITLPQAQTLIREALDFLGKAPSTNSYFVLECGEIFAMNNVPLTEQNQNLLNQIRNLDSEIEMALDSLKPAPIKPTKRPGFVARLFGAKTKAPDTPGAPADPLMPLYKLGLGNWSNVLYFHFGDA